jgi:hypothetical protein
VFFEKAPGNPYFALCRCVDNHTVGIYGYTWAYKHFKSQGKHAETSRFEVFPSVPQHVQLRTGYTTHSWYQLAAKQTPYRLQEIFLRYLRTAC